MASAGTVTINLDANSIKLLRELNKAQRATKRTAKKMQTSMTRSFKAIGIAVALAYGKQFLTQITNAQLAMDRMQRSLKIATGSAKLAAQEMEFIIETSQRLGINLEQAGQAFAKLSAAAKGTSIAGKTARDIFISISEAAVVLGLTAPQTQSLFVAIEQMISKGKISAEELRKQMQALPGAFPMAARSIGVTTMALDKMLKSGSLMVEDLLPQLAKEMHKTFGPGVADAATSAQVAFAKFGNAIFRLKASIAESGIVDALATMAFWMANIISPTLGVAISQAQTQIKSLRQTIERLSSSTPGFESPALTDFKNQLVTAEAKLDDLLFKQGRLLSPDFGDSKTTTATGDSSVLDALILKYETIGQKAKRLREELAKSKDAIIASVGAVEYQRMFEMIGAEMENAIQEIAILPLLKMKKNTEETFKEMDEFSRQAARNMQDAFADFLFDPFSEGLKGMVEGFLDAIRRMLANQAAAKFFNFLSNQGGFLGSFFGGTKAHGGPVTAGASYLVGEQGPELFTPGGSGMITPNHKLNGSGGTVINYNIEAGVDMATVMSVVVPALEATQRNTIAEIALQRREGVA